MPGTSATSALPAAGVVDPADRRFCRDALPRVSRTFALNTRLLAGTLGEAVRTGYLLCRAADALEDSWPGEPAAIQDRFGRFLAALNGDAAALASLSGEARALDSPRWDLALLGDLPRVLRVREALPTAHGEALSWGVGTLAAGMSRYAARAADRDPSLAYLDTETELDDYCWVVAGCVGVMLTRLFAAEYGGGATGEQERRLAAAPVVGQALQLTNILLDWPNDIRRGRCYVPASWLAEAGLEPRDLVDRPEPRALELARRLEAKARGALARVPDYLDLIPARRVRYRLFCLWPALWALASLRHARRDPEFPWGPRRPKLPRAEIWRAAVASSFAVHRGAALRDLYARATGRWTAAEDEAAATPPAR